jgi:hypothetical protein
MTAATTELDLLVQEAMQALVDPAGEALPEETSMRERFFELLVLILGNLYTKTPVAAALFDRNTLLRITTGMDDNDAGKLSQRSEDWLRLENLLRQQDGQKSYFVTRTALAVLSTITPDGTLGEVFDRVLRRYQEVMPSDNLRKATRMLGSYFIMKVSRS